MTVEHWHGTPRAGAGPHIAALEEENEGLRHNLSAAMGWVLTLRAQLAGSFHRDLELMTKQRDAALMRVTNHQLALAGAHKELAAAREEAEMYLDAHEKCVASLTQAADDNARLRTRLSALEERTRCPDPGEGAVSLADAALDRLGRGGMVFGPPSIAERNAQTVGDLIGLRRPEVAHPHARLEALREKAEPLCRPAPDPAPAVTREEILRVLRLARGEIDMEAAPLTYDAVNDLIAELDAEGGPRG